MVCLSAIFIIQFASQPPPKSQSSPNQKPKTILSSTTSNLKFSKFTTAAVSLSYTLSKFITRVFLLIMKNISHLNQYDQWPQHQNQNLSNSPPPHRAMIDWPTTGWPARKHKTPQLRLLGTHSDSGQNHLILICPPDMYFISASVLSGYWKISLCDDHS